MISQVEKLADSNEDASLFTHYNKAGNLKIKTIRNSRNSSFQKHLESPYVLNGLTKKESHESIETFHVADSETAGAKLYTARAVLDDDDSVILRKANKLCNLSEALSPRK